MAVRLAIHVAGGVNITLVVELLHTRPAFIHAFPELRIGHLALIPLQLLPLQHRPVLLQSIDDDLRAVVFLLQLHVLAELEDELFVLAEFFEALLGALLLHVAEPLPHVQVLLRPLDNSLATLLVDLGGFLVVRLQSLAVPAEPIGHLFDALVLFFEQLQPRLLQVLRGLRGRLDALLAPLTFGHHFLVFLNAPLLSGDSTRALNLVLAETSLGDGHFLLQLHLLARGFQLLLFPRRRHGHQAGALRLLFLHLALLLGTYECLRKVLLLPLSDLVEHLLPCVDLNLGVADHLLALGRALVLDGLDELLLPGVDGACRVKRAVRKSRDNGIARYLTAHIIVLPPHFHQLHVAALLMKPTTLLREGTRLGHRHRALLFLRRRVPPEKHRRGDAVVQQDVDAAWGVEDGVARAELLEADPPRLAQYFCRVRRRDPADVVVVIVDADLHLRQLHGRRELLKVSQRAEIKELHFWSRRLLHEADAAVLVAADEGGRADVRVGVVLAQGSRQRAVEHKSR
eukprot:PhM_4_TR670/c0_g1_i1/m.78883